MSGISPAGRAGSPGAGPAPTQAQRSSFGSTAILTPANAVTMVRVLAAPVLLALIWRWGPSWGLAITWLVLSCSDGLDGWVARRQGTTRSGAFLDPLADKLLVLAALAALALRAEISWLPVDLIAAREMAMSLYRTVVARQGISIPARKSAKLKTLTQDIAVALGLLPVLGVRHLGAVQIAVWVAAALTLWTGLQYGLDGRKLRASSEAS
ncbi:MAG: CDP-alcohol phosphatidyltransferase family protein [Actinobacteria bacterium]|nr:CDP-alcohol phosphatidyltransferase family protein [Actinomycetota bacterium]